MEDYKHLRKAQDEEDEDEKLELLTHDMSPTAAKECLENMKYISDLIAKVGFFNLFIYIGSYHIFEARVHLFDCVPICLCYSTCTHC